MSTKRITREFNIKPNYLKKKINDYLKNDVGLRSSILHY